MMLDLDYKLAAVELACELSMDSQRLNEVSACPAERVRQVALGMAEAYRNAAKMVR